MIVMDRTGLIYNGTTILLGDSNALQHSTIEKNLIAQYTKLLAKDEILSRISSESINTWLNQLNRKYVPTLVGCDISQQIASCDSFGISLQMFEKIECLTVMSKTLLEKSKTFQALANNHDKLNQLIQPKDKFQHRIDFLRAFLITGLGAGHPTTGHKDNREIWSRLLSVLLDTKKPKFDEAKGLQVLKML
jgi:hypothetical protein